MKKISIEGMRFVTIFSSIFVLFALSGCVISDQNSSESAYSRMTNNYASRNPVREAEKSFKQGDYEIYSAKSYSLYYPGLDFVVGETVAKKFGAKHIRGTSDVIESEEHRELNLVAFQFGSQYNQRKMQLLRDSGKLEKR